MTLKDLRIGESAKITAVGGEGALRQHFCLRRGRAYLTDCFPAFQQIQSQKEDFSDAPTSCGRHH